MSDQNSFISNFRNFLVKLILPFLVIIGAGGWAFSCFFEKEIILKNESCGAYKINRIIQETHPDEIPVFGSSRAEGGYIPDSLGSNFFNYGLSGTREDVHLFFLREECKKRKHTPYLILNFDLDGISYGQGDVANFIYNAQYKPVKDLLGLRFKKIYTIPFIKYYGFYEYYFKLFLNEKLHLTKFTNKGASVEKDILTENKFRRLVAERENTVTTFATDPELMKQLSELIDSNSERVFILVVAPYHVSYFSNYSNEAGKVRFFEELRKKKNIRIFDFSRIKYPDTFFLNTTHLNYQGAIRFNRELRDSLRQLIH
jgi:hypothetical protein